MIINSSKVKTEALLLFCRDLIESYINSDNQLFDEKKELKQFINTKSYELLNTIDLTIQPIAYYKRNIRVSRISIIVNTYQYINKNISKLLKKGDTFNPSMLCFALLSTWFIEIRDEKIDNEFLYFYLYPYGEIYDKLLLNLNDLQYKKLNIRMLDIAEMIIFKLNKHRLQ